MRAALAPLLAAEGAADEEDLVLSAQILAQHDKYDDVEEGGDGIYDVELERVATFGRDKDMCVIQTYVAVYCYKSP